MKKIVLSPYGELDIRLEDAEAIEDSLGFWIELDGSNVSRDNLTLVYMAEQALRTDPEGAKGHYRIIEIPEDVDFEIAFNRYMNLEYVAEVRRAWGLYDNDYIDYDGVHYPGDWGGQE